MKVPFVDLQAQYMAIEKEIEQAIADVIAKAVFIGSAYVSQFKEDFPAATEYSKEILSLPMFPEISKEQLQYVCNQFRDVIGG